VYIQPHSGGTIYSCSPGLFCTLKFVDKFKRFSAHMVCKALVNNAFDARSFDITSGFCFKIEHRFSGTHYGIHFRIFCK